jgi:hypothetical protein
MRFRNRAELNRAYARLVDQSWVESCTVDVPRLTVQVHVGDAPRHVQQARLWLRRQRGAGGPSE